MRNKAPLLVLATVFAFACTESPTDAGLEPPAPNFSLNPVVQSVSGSGHITSGGELRTFSFNARKRADGSVTGEWQRNTRSIGAKAHGDVTCFTIVGNQAWLGGVVERTTTIPGEVAWTVVDNSEGANSAADQISLQSVGGAPGFAAAFCASRPALALIPIEKGNIQVKG